MQKIQSELVRKIFEDGVTEEQLQQALCIFQAKKELQQGMENDKFFSEVEARKYSGNVSRSTFWHWKKKGLRSYKIGGRRLYRSEDIKRFVLLQSSTVGTADTVDTVDKNNQTEVKNG